jgi:hypothetical protein
VARTFEDGCRRVEAAAKSAQEAGRALQRGAVALAKASSTGDLSKLRSEAERMRTLGDAALSAARNAAAAWPMAEADEELYLKAGYLAELMAAAQDAGVKLLPYGDGFVAFPCLVKVEPRTGTARINRRRVRTLRPSALAAEVVAQQSKKIRFAPERFIEGLFAAYRLVTGGEIEKGTTLVDVYQSLTLLPDAQRDYPLEEFVRDVHLLDRSGVTTTRKGYVLSFPASTGTKTKTNVLEIVDDHGERHLYFGIRFKETPA